MDWGDNVISGWTRLLPSGKEYNISHVWDEGGTYEIRVTAKDENGAESEWTTQKVSMPKNKTVKEKTYLFTYNSFLNIDINISTLNKPILINGHKTGNK